MRVAILLKIDFIQAMLITCSESAPIFAPNEVAEAVCLYMANGSLFAEFKWHVEIIVMNV